MLTTLTSPDSPQESHKPLEPQPTMTVEDDKPQVSKTAHSFTRTSKEPSQIQGPVKRSSLLGALAHKLGKQSSKSKDSADGKVDAIVKRELQPNEIENLMMPEHQTQSKTFVCLRVQHILPIQTC